MSKLKMSKLNLGLAAVAVALTLSGNAFAFDTAADKTAPKISGVGMKITQAALKPWDISYFYDGTNLPDGKGTVSAGEKIYNKDCAMCHGDFGEGAHGYPKMVGDPVDQFEASAKAGVDAVGNRGINNTWGNAPTLMDEIHRHMPFYAPGTLTVDESYSATCYVLNLANIVDDNFVCDKESLPKIVMPGEKLYTTNLGSDTHNIRCMKDCYKGTPAVVQKAASIGDVSVGKVEKRDSH
jgi:cytochrome c5